MDKNLQHKENMSTPGETSREHTRVDALEKVTGQAKYVDDLPNLPRMAFAQVSIPCVAPAIGNAIYDAVGVRVRSTPFTPEKVLRTLGVIPSS